ncbi:ribosome hibernation-promoting factor, HPF/YfiA family [Haliangium ochraceum]|uniref:Ribosome hibernation promoting factor n=1 Tax=Haliangium ochraceum (strain DSM 14365 / JCM 11303 / SMP-2) TaxID=502025 RepID=D0LNA7_HALO1|nr:ribosome-associated translation inhibitor RaiA [Haliangium ochraceum]ACY15284.1 sigma 54 modulation protein/ribosomal protein S30EA [Haliangium ochraceum DSM 14365]
MQFSVTFRQTEATEALKEYARDRMERIKKYFPDPISVHVVMSTERGYKHRVDVTMQLHNGLTVAGRETSESMHSSIDLVTAKIERQVRRYKDKLRTHKVKNHIPSVPWSHTVLSDSESENESQVAEGAELDVAAEAVAGAEHIVVRTEKFHADPMSVSEAIMQLNLGGQQFLVFRHDESGRVNVVYHRGDGSYGLIEATPPEAASAA